MALGQSSGGPGRQLSIFLSLTSPLARNAKSNKTKPKSRGHSLCGEKLEVPQRQGQASSQEGSPPEKKRWGFRRQRKASWRKGRTKPRRVGNRRAQPSKPKETTTEVRWRKNLGFPEGTRDSSWQEERPKPKRVVKRSAQNRSEWSRGAPNQQNRKNSDSVAVGKKLGVSRRNARRVGQRGAQNRGEEERPKPKRVVKRSAQPTKPKEQRQCRGGEKTWGFQTERKESRPEGRPKPRRRGAPKTEASGQEERPTNKTERTATVARWGKNLGFPDGTQGESARGAPKTEASRQEERPTNKIERTATEARWGKNLGFPEVRQGEPAKGAPKSEASGQEERPTNKTERTATVARWGKNLGFPDGTQGESARGAPKTEERRQEERPTNKTESTATEARWGKKLGFPEGMQGESAKGAPKTEARRQEERPTNKTERTATEGRWGKNLGFPEGTQGESAKGAPKTEASRQEERPTNKTERTTTEARWGKNLGFPEGTQGESARGAPKTEASRQEERPTYKTERASERGAVGKKLGVSRGNARRVGEMGAQNRDESARGAPNQQNRKNKRQRCGGENTWGFQRERKASRRNGRPKPRRVGKRSAQPTKPKEQATEVRWGENLGFPEGTQGESARGVPNTEASRQEERPTNKTQRAGDRGEVGRKLGVSRGNARGVGQRGAQHRGESPRGAPNQQNPMSRRQRCGGEKTWGFQRERKASRPEGRRTPRRVAKRSAQPTKPKEPATEVWWRENLGFPEGTQGESARGAPNTEASRQEERPNRKTQRASDRGAVG